jgi:hypothetical protein
MMPLEFRSEEKRELRIVALDPPSGECVGESFSADDTPAAEVFPVLAIEPACEQNFQKEPI